MKKPRVITLDTVCNLTELAEFCGMGKSTVYEKTAGENGYKLQYPAIGRTTPRHFLEWCEKTAPATPEEPGEAERREREIRRLRSIADTPREPKSSRGSRSALPRREKSLAGHSARS